MAKTRELKQKIHERKWKKMNLIKPITVHLPLNNSASTLFNFWNGVFRDIRSVNPHIYSELGSLFVSFDTSFFFLLLSCKLILPPEF